MRTNKKLRTWALDPFAKIKINEELKLKLKEGKNLFFCVFNVLRFNRKRINQNTMQTLILVILIY